MYTYNKTQTCILQNCWWWQASCDTRMPEQYFCNNLRYYNGKQKAFYHLFQVLQYNVVQYLTTVFVISYFYSHFLFSLTYQNLIIHIFLSCWMFLYICSFFLDEKFGTNVFHTLDSKCSLSKCILFFILQHVLICSQQLSTVQYNAIFLTKELNSHLRKYFNTEYVNKYIKPVSYYK